jgi:hypothetical protein
MTNAELMTNGDKNHVSSFRLRHSFVLRHSDFVIKKYRPPRPMDVKGGCSPQNNLGKLRCK